MFVISAYTTALAGMLPLSWHADMNFLLYSCTVLITNSIPPGMPIASFVGTKSLAYYCFPTLVAWEAVVRHIAAGMVMCQSLVLAAGVLNSRKR